MRFLLFVIAVLVGSQSFAATKRWVPKISTGRIFFVDTNGSDAANGLTTGTAWKTVSKVNGATFLAGDTVEFHAGQTWVELLVVPHADMTFDRYSTGPNPLIDANSTGNAITVSSKNNVTINSIEVTNGLSDGILITGTATNCVLNNVVTSHSHGGSGNGIHADTTTTGTANNCTNYLNEDNGFSLHNSAVWTISGGTYNSNANCGIYNIQTSICHVSGVICNSNTSAGIQVTDGAYIDVINATCLTNLYAFSAGVGGWMNVTNSVGNQGRDGANLNSASVLSIFQGCAFTNNWEADINLTQGKACLYSNIFAGTNQFAIGSQSGTTYTNWWALYVDCAGSNPAGTFNEAMCVHYGDSASANHYAHRVSVDGAGNLIENCYVNSSDNYAWRSDANIFKLRNSAARNCSGGTYFGSGTTTNCMGDNNDLPSGNGNIRSATFTAQFVSLTPGNASFAIPNTTGQAYQGGTTLISGAPVYFNGVAVSGTANIGAMGGGQ